MQHGRALADFAEAAWRRDESLGPARSALRIAVGDEGVAEAAYTVAIFRSLNIAADASGIPLDNQFVAAAAGYTAGLGLERFPTAANSAPTG